ncbi:MAG TPA: YdeI/OmpD-associated family protein [Bacteroidia bacterium]|jgi:hypothetical protein
MKEFNAVIKIIGINPYVSVPGKILRVIFKEANKDKGPIPVRGFVNGSPYTQTLMKFKGEWRLYINTGMLKDSPRRIGETIKLSVEFDPRKRTVPVHPGFITALKSNKEAAAVFAGLSPSRQNEIVRYIANLKTEGSIQRNILKAVLFLSGKSRFAGRDKP